MIAGVFQWFSTVFAQVIGGFLRWLVAFVAMLVGVTLLTLPPPSTMIAITADTETLQVTALNREEASFLLVAARRLSDDRCLNNVRVFPSAGTRITYTRPEPGALFIAIEGAVSISEASSEGREQNLTHSDFETFRIDAECGAGSGMVRLPLNGLLEVGLLATETYATETPFVLLSGEATVYARAVDRALWGFLPIGLFAGFLAVEPGGLFEVNALTLPAGSQIAEAVYGKGSDPARWWGHADIAFGEASPAIMVRASTNASALRIFAPAPRTAANVSGAASLVPETISVAALARITGDPNLQWLYVLGGLISAMLGVVWLMLFYRRASTEI